MIDRQRSWLLALVVLVLAVMACAEPVSPAITSRPIRTPTPAFERTEAQVVEVVDGDTIKVSVDGQIYTVRYIGIDTPETVHPSEPIEWMGPEASEANRQLVDGQTVYLEKDVSETDQHGRLLRYVFLLDGTFVNAELVRMGYAQVSTYPPDVRYQGLFLAMQQEARDAGRGLWGPRPGPTEASSGLGDVQITYIHYDGQVPQVESDEYVVLENEGDSPVNLLGWRLNAGDEGEDFWFPDFVLPAGQECRVYTNEYHAERGMFTFGSDKALWANEGDCGHLYDASGVEVSVYCY